MRDAFARVLEQEMEQNERIVLITGDLGFGVLRRIHERFPNRLINAGIAEQGMVSMAAGLASTGRTVLVYSNGNFPVLRPLQQIRKDCVYHSADVKIVCVGGGFVYGSLGMSHHATEDMAIMRAIPGIICYTPGDPAETEAVTHDMLWRKGTCSLRLGRGGEPAVHDGPVKRIKKLKEPILMLQSLEDEFSKPDKAGLLFDLCQSEKKIVYFDHGEHSRIRPVNREKFDETIIDFLSKL